MDITKRIDFSFPSFVAVIAGCLGGFFLFGLSTYAAFSLGGSVITQTGTDSNLAGLSAIAGVTTQVIGVGTEEKTYYFLDTAQQLIVDGDLTFDPDYEVLVFGQNAPDNAGLRINGTLNYGVASTVNGNTKLSSGEGLIFTRNGGSRTGNAQIRLDGGHFQTRGGVIRTPSVIDINNGGSVDWEGTTFLLTHNVGAGDQDNERDIRFDGNNPADLATSRIVDCVFRSIGNGFWYFGYRGSAYPPIFEPTLEGAVIGNFVQDNPDVTIRNLITSSNTADSDLAVAPSNAARVQTFFIINAELGSGVRTLPRFDNRGGVVRISKELSITTTDQSNSPVEDAVAFIRDTDNGNRVSENSFDDTQDYTYTHLTDGVGETGVFEVLTAVYNRPVGLASSDPWDTGNNIYDRRSKSGFTYGSTDQDDLFDINIWSYNHTYSQLSDISLKGVGPLDINTVLIEDTNISEDDAGVVLGYGTIDTLDQLYDRAKAWKTDPTNIEYPVINTQLVSANGSMLDLGSQNLVIDPTAPQVFDVDTGITTITINTALLSAGALFESFTTTGLVTYQNGAIQNTDYTDSTEFYPVDSSAPVITITSQVPTKIDSQPITVDIQVTDDREVMLDDVQVSLANTTAGVASFTCIQTSTVQVDCMLQVLSSGDIEIRAEDARGLSTTELDLNYIIDTQAPVITASLDTSAPFSTSSPEVIFSATDNIDVPGDITFTVSVDNGPFVAQSSPYTPTLVGDRHVIVIRATDTLGNSSEYNFIYTPLISIIAPTTTSNSDIVDTIINVSSSNDITDVTVAGAGSTFVCTPATPSSTPVTCTGIVTATGTLTIDATDTLISDSTTVDYVIERNPPVITITAPTSSGIDAITDTTVQVTDDVAVNASDVFIDGSSTSAARLFDCVQASVTQVDCTIDIASSGDLIILARDRSSNESTAGETYTVIPSGLPQSAGGGGSRSLLVCTDDPAAVNYYPGDLSEFGFYGIVERCMYGDDPVAVIPESEPVVDVSAEVQYDNPQCSISYYRIIKRGIRGIDVQEVQRCMNSLGYTSGPEDGIYGPLTYAGITSYQRAHNLQYVDGIVGPETSTSLNTLGNVGASTQ